MSSPQLLESKDGVDVFLDDFEDLDKNLNDVHAQEIQRLRDMFGGEEGINDVLLFRFLRGWNYNMDTTIEKISNSIKWRKTPEVQMSTQVWPYLPEKVVTNCADFPFGKIVSSIIPSSYFHGFDKAGHPVTIDLWGVAKFELIGKIVFEKEIEKFQVFNLENRFIYLNKYSQEKRKCIRMTKIIDLSGLEIGKLVTSKKFLDGIGILKKILAWGSENYPETMGPCYITNAPWLFSMGWKLVSPVLHPRTVSKISVLSPSETPAFLREKISSENLPKFLGGTCTCPHNIDTLNRELNDDDACYVSNLYKSGCYCIPYYPIEDGYKTVQIKAGGVYVHQLNVVETLPQSFFQSRNDNQKRSVLVIWHYRITDGSHEFKFGINYIKGPEKKVIFPLLPSKGADKTTSGSYTFEFDNDESNYGKLVFTFDNKDAYWFTKTLKFHVEIQTEQANDEKSSPTENPASISTEIVDKVQTEKANDEKSSPTENPTEPVVLSSY